MNKTNKFLDVNQRFLAPLTKDIEHARMLIESKQVTGYAVIVNYKDCDGSDKYSMGMIGNALELTENLSQGIAEWVLLQQLNSGSLQ